MNRTEQRYALHLAALKSRGRVQWYAFEHVKWRLAANAFYTPDFLVVDADGTLECHEVKGSKRVGDKRVALWTEDARLKIRWAANELPIIRFLAVHEHGPGTWAVEEF
jgi:hypothetical protein